MCVKTAPGMANFVETLKSYNSIVRDHPAWDKSGSHRFVQPLYAVVSELLDGNEVFFRIKRSTQLKKLMNAYCDRQSVDMKAIAFLFDGRRLRAEQTPDELEMEDGDEIDAMLHQTGGRLPPRA
ncbi:small ubiquitin-related modifier 1 [Triticum aestivum]|uniref:small ubiquitin-related modifier 1 n=1 Tax=Triticum aestivum TaxID=4565 RepID=UPI001D012C8B|nr:small ubiquitin-related modifier 1-like [Triticum aestivum]